GVVHYGKSLFERGPKLPRVAWLGVILPAIALCLFGTLFVLANPDLVNWVRETVDQLLNWQTEWFRLLTEKLPEVLFCLAAGWLVIGLLRPLELIPLLPALAANRQSPASASETSSESPLYAALRNTLVAVSVLFAVYLAFEFKTLWFRRFPEGFYYAGYA